MIAQNGKPGLQNRHVRLGLKATHAVASMSQWPPKPLKHLCLLSDQSLTNFSSVIRISW